MSDFLQGMAFFYNDRNNRECVEFDTERFSRICTILQIDQDRIYEWENVRHEVDDEDGQNETWSQRFSEVDYVLVFHGSHGTFDGRVKTKSDVNTVMEIRAIYLEPLFKYAALNGKLKWIVLQCCRGNTKYVDDGVYHDGDEEERYPNYYVVTFPTKEGNVSGRATQEAVAENNGSKYLRYLEDALRSNWQTTGLLQILDEVIERASRENPSEQPTYSQNIPGDFYFQRNHPDHLK